MVICSPVHFQESPEHTDQEAHSGTVTMGAPTEMRQRADLRDYLAAERTFLAWVRTGLALMGFGFVVARFGLFLEQLQVFQRAAPASSSGLSLWFGTALIAVGVVVNLSSTWRHVRLVRELDQGEPASSRSLTQAVATAVFLALVGLVMAIYLLSVPFPRVFIPKIVRRDPWHLERQRNH